MGDNGRYLAHSRDPDNTDTVTDTYRTRLRWYMQVMEKTRPVSSTFPQAEAPEMWDSRIEETPEAAIKRVRKQAGVYRDGSEHTSFSGSI